MKKDINKEKLENISEDTNLMEIVQQEVGEEQVCYLYFPIDLNADLTQYPKTFYETETMRFLTNQIFEHLASLCTDYCILSGGISVGKTAIVENIVQKILSGEAPTYFDNHQFIMFDAFEFIGIEPKVIIQSIYMSIKTLCEKEIFDIVVFIKHFDNLDPAIRKVLHQLTTQIREEFENINLKYIFSVYSNFWDVAEEDPYLINAFIKTVESPKYEDMFNILLPQVIELENIHHCTISKKLLKLLISLVMANHASLNVSIKNYVVFIDLVLTRGELAGKNEVDIEDVNKNFELSFQDWKKLSPSERARIAFHESGHTVLGLIALSDYYQLACVTCVPSIELSSLGATIEFFKSHLYNVDRKILKKFLAFYYAGREAEKIAGYPTNNGARSDLGKASDMLVDFIASTGISKKLGKNYSYDMESLISNEAILEIEAEAKKIAKKASKYSKKILNKNWALVESIANRLLENGLVSGDEVEKIYQNYLKKKK